MPPGSSAMICLLVLFLLIMLAAYLAFTVYCACHVDTLGG